MGYAGIKDIRMFIKSLYKYRKMRNNSRKPVGVGGREEDGRRNAASVKESDKVNYATRHHETQRERERERSSSAKTVML